MKSCLYLAMLSSITLIGAFSVSSCAWMISSSLTTTTTTCTSSQISSFSGHWRGGGRPTGTILALQPSSHQDDRYHHQDQNDDPSTPGATHSHSHTATTITASVSPSSPSLSCVESSSVSGIWSRRISLVGTSPMPRRRAWTTAARTLTATAAGMMALAKPTGATASSSTTVLPSASAVITNRGLPISMLLPLQQQQQQQQQPEGDAEENNNIDKEMASSSSSSFSTSSAMTMLILPTFCLVDRQGVPFMVVGEDAKVSAYFFLDYQEAQRILDLVRPQQQDTRRRRGRPGPAPKDNDEDNDDDEQPNPWQEARISTVPLTTAAALAFGSQQRRGGWGRSGGNYFYLAPAPTAVQAALDWEQVQKKPNLAKPDAEAEAPTPDLAEGRVPLFYLENFTLPAFTTTTTSNSRRGNLGSKAPSSSNNNNNNATIIPLYFDEQQLLQEYADTMGRTAPVPPVQVTELWAVWQAWWAAASDSLLVGHGDPASSAPTSKDVEDLNRLVLMPLPDSERYAQTCRQQQLREGRPALVLGRRNLVL